MVLEKTIPSETPDNERKLAQWRIGVDVGGTFTDMVVAGPDGAIEVFKLPSTPANPEKAVLAAVAKAAAYYGKPTCEFLGCVSHFIHGTTIATNTALEGKGARVGMVVTDGFRDALEIRRGIREDSWDHHAPYAPVLVPRDRRLPVRGRLDASGVQLAPLSADDVGEVALRFRDDKVEAIAICLMNSFIDDSHEREAEALLSRALPGTYLTRSSTVAPIMGEYERGSTAVLNSYVGPRTVSYLKALESELHQAGLRTELLLVQNNGGISSVGEVADRPVNLMLSGPAAAVGSLGYFSKLIGKDSLISMEIGGTSCDVMLMRDGVVNHTDRLHIAGYDVVTPSVEVHTIGTGGGTIARVDEAGLLILGPQGAGAVPGPACYALGGEKPTVTDAHVVLGRFDAGTYADGAVTIDMARARRAIEEKIALPLGLSVEEAAIGIIRLMDQQLCLAVQKLSTERGNDPKEFDLVAGGGAGPLHGVAVARALGCRSVYAPRISGAFCALGMLASNCRQDHIRFHRSELDAADLSALHDAVGEVGTEVMTRLLREGFERDEAIMQYSLDLRYVGQQWDITVPVDFPLRADRIRADFDALHQRYFGHVQPGGRIEIRALRAAATGLLPQLEVPSYRTGRDLPQPVETRPIWVDLATGWCEVPCYDGATLFAGHNLVGPAIVNEKTTTLLIGAGDALCVDAGGNFHIVLEDNDHA